MENQLVKKIIIGLAALVVLITVLYFMLVFRSPAPSGVGNRDPQVVSDVVREALANSPAYALSGTITKIGNQGITLDVPQVLSVSIPADSDLRAREVTVSDATKITIRTRKSDAELAPELAAYRAKKGPPPSPYSPQVIALSDLKVGDAVTVQGGAGIDIGLLASINAAAITKITE